jgi:peptidoglycan/LPS O-acetylase OafA/YrhL
MVDILILTPTRLDALVMGAFFGSLARGPGGLHLHGLAIRRAAWMAASLVVTLFVAQHLSGSGSAMRRLGPSVVGVTIVGVTMGLFVACVAMAPTARLVSALDAAWLSWLGTVSYGLYVYHHPVSIWLQGQVDSPVMRTALLLGISIPIAAGSWYAFEHPILSLKRRWPMPTASDPVTIPVEAKEFC